MMKIESHKITLNQSWNTTRMYIKSVESNPVQETHVVRRSSRILHEPERYYEFLLTQDGDVMLMDNDEPLTYQDAMSSPDSERWLETMKSEMESMYHNKVWTLLIHLKG